MGCAWEETTLRKRRGSYWGVRVSLRLSRPVKFTSKTPNPNFSFKPQVFRVYPSDKFCHPHFNQAPEANGFKEIFKGCFRNENIPTSGACLRAK